MNVSETPLAGVRVLELSHMVMGPSAGLILADLGATVIKVEPPGGDKTRKLRGSGAGFFPMYARNRQSICIDLKTDQGRETVRRLLGGVDALIENFRSGALAGLKLDYDSLRDDFPQLIYCSLKGFLSGPYAHRTALDEVTQMMGGLAYMTGPSGRPLRAGASVIDVLGGTFGALGILAALHERRRTGQGQHLSSGLFESTAFLVGQHMAQEAVTGEPAPPMPERAPAWAIYDVFQCADALPLFVAVVSNAQWQAFCREFGRDDWLGDARLAENNDRVAARGWLLDEVRALFAGMTRTAAIERIERIGLPFAPIARPSELFEDEHLNSGGLVEVTLPDSDTKTRLPGLPLEIDGRRTRLREDLAAPGAHSRRVLQEAGFAAEEIDELFASGSVT
ncbi:MAG: CoA transferase [Gammaproteobacteria bacterium AqS3]|nr:CoA transferase [Gammaproteobacteria bacterium AqS3]